MESIKDSLTGLANFEALEQIALHSAGPIDSAPRAFTLLLLNVNRFRAINDVFGHFAGDEFLREIAARLSVLIAAPNVAARIGGDEFAILLRSCASDTAALSLAERILEDLSGEILLDGAIVQTSYRVGAAHSTHDDRDVGCPRFG